MTNAITFIRKKAGLSQAAFAEEAEVSQATVSRWENDPAPPGDCYRIVRHVGRKLLGDDWRDEYLFGAPETG